jgi:hypothetical protein
MTMSIGSQNAQVDRRQTQQTEAPKKVESSSTQAAEQAKPTAPAQPAEQARTPADTATVDAARARAAGNEDMAKQRALSPQAQAAEGTAPARGLLHDIRKKGSGRGISAEEGEKNCLHQGPETQTDPAQLLEEIRKKGSGRPINDDGECRLPTAPETMDV